ncbi:MAG: hypothetical protein KDB91_11495 [Bacteroidales bacterium]|nr:hypothetical protein [Bacteroidales bacterium]
MKNSSLPLIPALVTLLFLASCGGDRAYKNMREGEIYYTINYVSNPSRLSSNLLPKELVIAFRNDLISTSLKSPIGNSGITTVVNPGENIYDTYLNILAFKYYFEGNYRDVQPGFGSMEGISVHDTGRKSVICGFNCHQARVEMPDGKKSRYIWYTTEIKAENPNRMTPYREVDGVLMDFFYIIGDAELQFTADEVLVKKVADKEFERKNNYRKVSSKYLDTLILKMISF